VKLPEDDQILIEIWCSDSSNNSCADGN